ncbi:MAG: alginate export family protein, partial [Planctomycetota bacterium]
WGNASRHFDGAILTYRCDERTKIDLGYAELVNGDVNDDGTAGTNSGAGVNVLYPGRTAGTASDPDEDYDIYWLWLTTKISNETTVDAYDILEYDGESNYIGESPYLNAVDPNPQIVDQGILHNQGHLKRHTTGVQINWDNQDFYGNASYNGQWGTIASDQIRALGWSGYVGARFDRENLKHDVRFGVRYASGDGDANDRESTRFRPLFMGCSHESNGILDLVGWSNSVSKYVTYSFNPHPKVRLTSAYFDLERYNDDDSWYNDAGAVIRTGKAFDSANPHPNEGMSGSRDIGDEVDVVVNYKHTDFLDFEAGFAHLFKGRLAEETADLPDAQMTYVQARLRF